MSYRGPLNPVRPPPDGEAAIIIYGYVPSLALGALAVALFGAALSAHTWWFVKGGGERRRKGRTEGVGRARGWGVRTFEGLICLGCLMEIVGYAFRIYSHKRPFVVVAFVVQYFMIVCAPVAFAAAFYVALKYALSCNPANARVLPIRQRLFVGAFVTVDIITTIIQIAGAALIGTAESAAVQGKPSSITPETANNILLAGLALQCASFFVFLGLLTYIVIRVLRARSLARRGGVPSSTAGVAPPAPHTDSDSTLHGPAPAPAVRTEKHTAHTSTSSGGFLSPHGIAGHTFSAPFLAVLYLTAGMLFLRTVFRLAETAEGLFGYASTHEYLFGTFEFAPVITAILLWAVMPLKTFIDRMVVKDGPAVAV